jgi:hypothetical protein
MKKLKHSKFKNTSVLFEMLVRQIASDTLNNTKSKSIPLIKKYFHKNTELYKELGLYQTLIKERFKSKDSAEKLIEAVVESRNKLNLSSLNREKYNLIREIRKHYSLDTFFKSTVSDYKVMASIYRIFEYKPSDNPAELIRTTGTLLEHITNSTVSNQAQVESNMVLNEYSKQDKDVRLLAYRLLVDKFNTKYSNLSISQKKLLREYINSIGDISSIKSYIDSDVAKLQKVIAKYLPKVDDTILKIKLNESVTLLNKIADSKKVNDDHILRLLHFHELSNELKTIFK